MPFIKTIAPHDATGLVKEEYDRAVKRAGKVFNILSIQSLRGDVLRASMDIYIVLMKTRGELTRAQKEMIAVLVSRANDCFY